MLCKFQKLSKEHQELKDSKVEINDPMQEQSIPYAIPFSKVDVSISCNLFDDSNLPPCNEKCHEKVVEILDDLVGKENEELKQEVDRLMKALASLKGKTTSTESYVQSPQDNRDYMVKKLEKGETVTCFKCHGEGHKSYQCPQVKRKAMINKNKKVDKEQKNKKNTTIQHSLFYTKPNRKNKVKRTSYVIKKKINGKVVARKVGRRE